MRGRFWVAAVAAASPILLFGAAIGTRGFAQETATAEDAADPNAGAATPAEQSAKPDAMLAPASRLLTEEETIACAELELEAQHHMAKVFEARRIEPRDDLMSALVHVH